MAKQMVKKRKLRLFRLLLFLTTIIVILFCAYLLINSKIKNIIIKGNNYYSDEEIIKQSGLTNYPSFFLTLNIKIKNSLKKLPVISKVTIKRSFFNIVTIKVEEHRILMKNSLTNNYILSNKEEISLDEEYRVPRLINTTPKNKFNSLVSNMSTINKSILGQISQIEYVPNTYDKDRFLLYMDDGNSVYLTLTKFEMINYYDKVLAQLEGRKGVLYLDSGNHFVIKE